MAMNTKPSQKGNNINEKSGSGSNSHIKITTKYNEYFMKRDVSSDSFNTNPSMKNYDYLKIKNQ